MTSLNALAHDLFMCLQQHAKPKQPDKPYHASVNCPKTVCCPKVIKSSVIYIVVVKEFILTLLLSFAPVEGI